MPSKSFPFTLSVLDQSPIPEGFTAADALHNSLELARLTDQLGYHRYWVAEHHGTPGLACNSPEVLIGPLAAATQRIRVGSGGIMLPHYSPLKVAENFGMLSNLYPGRIDLGVGRAAGTSRAVSIALQRDRRHAAPDDFPEQFDELLNYMEQGAQKNPLAKPEIWLLGSSPQSAIWAAELGLPYCFADFINSRGAEFTQLYKQGFAPSLRASQPQVAVAAWVICAETDDEARRLSLSARMMFAQLVQGKLIPVPTVEHAEEFLQSQDVPLEMLTANRRFITGSPQSVRASLEALSSEYGANELLLVNILHDHAARLHSYELVAREFGLAAAQNVGRAVA